jgi:P27 family predicted phage terminase small subunit
MQAPASLSPQARESFDRAVTALEAIAETPEHFADAIETFALASERAAAIRQAWQDSGRPMLRSGSGPARAHPLVKAMQDAEVHASNLGSALLLDPAARAKAQRGSGWQRGQARAPDRQPGRLRAVRDDA